MSDVLYTLWNVTIDVYRGYEQTVNTRFWLTKLNYLFQEQRMDNVVHEANR